MWVQIEKVILKSEERQAKIPQDTKKHNYIMRLNGFLNEENPKIGSNVTIKTLAGRKVEGKLIKINPEYSHNFGKPVEELMHIGQTHRNILEEING
ncbi:MAG: 2-amino-4-oxopentanoate thiolase subunit OrtA [Candidatus Muirbacterium halophilum]|nr:2-amino-4-oxopentanoate thiolase subunit OrtA [Candidatus Muirbacterium halophilum]